MNRVFQGFLGKSVESKKNVSIFCSQLALPKMKNNIFCFGRDFSLPNKLRFVLLFQKIMEMAQTSNFCLYLWCRNFIMHTPTFQLIKPIQYTKPHEHTWNHCQCPNTDYNHRLSIDIVSSGKKYIPFLA